MRTSGFVCSCNDPPRTRQSCLASLREEGTAPHLVRWGRMSVASEAVNVPAVLGASENLPDSSGTLPYSVLAFFLDMLDMHGSGVNWGLAANVWLAAGTHLDPIRQNSISGHASWQGGWNMYITHVPGGRTNTITPATLGALFPCKDEWCLAWVIRGGRLSLENASFCLRCTGCHQSLAIHLGCSPPPSHIAQDAWHGGDPTDKL